MASPDKLITLITGGNSGIGKSLAGLLLENPQRHVIITSRSASKGSAAIDELRALGHPGTIEVLPLDQTDQTSVNALADEIEKRYGRLDALVNNAAIATFPPSTPLQSQLTSAFLSNATGPAILLTALWPLLLRTPHPPARIINHSSGAGSNGVVLGMAAWDFPPVPLPYFMSKAALNMLSSAWILDHREEEAEGKFKLFTYCPGFTESNLGEHNKVAKGAKPTVEGARPMVSLLDGERDGEHGAYVNHEGGRHPW